VPIFGATLYILLLFFFFSSGPPTDQLSQNILDRSERRSRYTRMLRGSNCFCGISMRCARPAAERGIVDRQDRDIGDCWVRWCWRVQLRRRRRRRRRLSVRLLIAVVDVHRCRSLARSLVVHTPPFPPIYYSRATRRPAGSPWRQLSPVRSSPLSPLPYHARRRTTRCRAVARRRRRLLGSDRNPVTNS